MARLTERDGRPVRQFKVGDIVLPHPTRSDLLSVGDGIVLRILNVLGNSAYGPTSQMLLVYWAAKDVDLQREARRFARAAVMEPGFEPDGMRIVNADLQFVRSRSEWLDAPTIEEVQMMRFADVAEEL
jgi:hypothetical protein